MRKIYRVKLFGEERAYLEELVRVGKAAARTLTHARVLLKAHEGPGGPAWNDDQTIEALEVSRSTVERVRTRCVEEGPGAALRPRPSRQLRLRKLDGAQEVHLIAVACSPAPKAASTGLCVCSPTNWSSWRWSMPCRMRRCGAR
jgi:hypothetical protein